MLSRFSVGTYQGNEPTRSASGNTGPRSPQLTEPLWTDPGLKNGISVRNLISTYPPPQKKKKKKRRRGMNRRTFPQSQIIMTSAADWALLHPPFFFWLGLFIYLTGRLLLESVPLILPLKLKAKEQRLLKMAKLAVSQKSLLSASLNWECCHSWPPRETVSSVWRGLQTCLARELYQC